MRPWLEDDEIAELCRPLEQSAAQIRYLKRLGLHVERKPNGTPLLMRSELERVQGAGRVDGNVQNAPGRQPDRAALLEVITGGRRGPQTQGR